MIGRFSVCDAQAGKETKFYQTKQASLVHKILIPVVLIVAAGAAGPFFLLPYEEVSHTCTDPFKAMKEVIKQQKDSGGDGETTTMDQFSVYDLYSTFVTVFTYILPVRNNMCMGAHRTQTARFHSVFPSITGPDRASGHSDRRRPHVHGQAVLRAPLQATHRRAHHGHHHHRHLHRNRRRCHPAQARKAPGHGSCECLV